MGTVMSSESGLPGMRLFAAIALLCIALAGCSRKEEPIASSSASEPVIAGNPEEPRWISRDSSKPARAAVVFIHGIFGSTTGTWQNENGTTFFQLLKQDPNVGDAVDVYAFGFESKMFQGGKGSLDVREAANVLGRYLSNADVLKYDTVVLVGHSMGGLVALRFLASNRDANLAAKIPLVVLFAAPQEGADVASIGMLASQNPGLVSMRPSDDNQWLQQLLDDWLRVPAKPKVVCGYEKAETRGIMVVPYSSSTRLCTEPGMAVGGADHISIVKPNTAAHPSVVLLVDALRAVIGDDRAAKLDTPDFVQEGNAWTVSMNTSDRQARIMNLGKNELSYWVAEAKGNGLVIFPSDAKLLAGDAQDNIRMLLLLEAADSTYSFRVKTKQGDDRLVTVAADLEKIRARQRVATYELVEKLNARLQGLPAGEDAQNAILEVASAHVEKDFPKLPEAARWIATADALSAASLDPMAKEALNRAKQSSPDLAMRYEAQRQLAPRFKELDQKVKLHQNSVDATRQHLVPGPAPSTDPTEDLGHNRTLVPRSGFDAMTLLSDTRAQERLQAFNQLAVQLKNRKGLESNGHLLDARLNAANGNLDMARQEMQLSRQTSAPAVPGR